MNQPTPVTVRHECGTCGRPGRTTYHVRDLTFTRPRDAIRAADTFDRGINYVSPLRGAPDDLAGHGGLRAETSGLPRSDDAPGSPPASVVPPPGAGA